jgi:hypothetical protein
VFRSAAPRTAARALGAAVLLLLALVPAVAGAADATRADFSLRHIIVDPDDRRFDHFLLTNYLNTAFDTAQVSGTFSQKDYWRNHLDIFDILANPVDSIEDEGGWDDFFLQEFASARLLPNLTLHLLGNGYDFRALAEWYDQRRVPYPYLWAFFSSYAGYIGNEAIESSNPEMDEMDPIADLYIFNLAGNLLFMSDKVADFVQNRAQMRNWTGQPVLDVRHGEIRNATNNYVLRPPLFGEKIRPFLYFGLHYFGGVSLRLPDASAMSLGVGLAATDPLREIDTFSDNFNTIRPAAGVFWDRDDRLLASLVLNGTEELLVRANVYPELLVNRIADLGFYLGIADDGVPSFGVIVQRGVGLGFS